MDKSYVSLAVCPICREDTGTLLLDQKLRPKFDKKTVTPEPCETCKEKYLKNGVMLLNPETGGLVVIKVSAFKRAFNIPVPAQHIAFCEQQVLEIFQPKGGEL